MIPVCCATVIPPQAVDNLIRINEEHSMIDNHLTFIDDLTAKYEIEEKLGDRTQPTSAPFKDKNPIECCKLLHEAKLFWDNYQGFIIMDERSLSDGTVLLVEASVDVAAEPHKWYIQTLRLAPELAQEKALLLLAGKHEDMRWLQTVAKKAENEVLTDEMLEAIYNGEEEPPF